MTEYIDYFLNPLSKKHNSYLKDTNDFVNKLKSIRVPTNLYVFLIDVDSLYTNIYTVQCFERYPDASCLDDVILDLLQLTLTKNNFEFNGK